MARHIGGAGRANEAQRAAAAEDPRREPDIRQADGVVGVEMREQHRIEAGQELALPDLEEALRGAAPGIDEQALAAGFDEDRRAEALHVRPRVAGAEQRDLEGAGRLGRCGLAAHQGGDDDRSDDSAHHGDGVCHGRLSRSARSLCLPAARLLIFKSSRLMTGTNRPSRSNSTARVRQAS